jgi:hypothetical protein
MRIAIGGAHTGLSNQESVASLCQALSVPKTALIESSVGVAKLPWELNVGREVFKLRTIL